MHKIITPGFSKKRVFFKNTKRIISGCKTEYWASPFIYVFLLKGIF